jgi:hypothetical protein
VIVAITVLLHGVGDDPVRVENVFLLYSGSSLSSCYCGFAYLYDKRRCSCERVCRPQLFRKQINKLEIFTTVLS